MADIKSSYILRPVLTAQFIDRTTVIVNVHILVDKLALSHGDSPRLGAHGALGGPVRTEINAYYECNQCGSEKKNVHSDTSCTCISENHSVEYYLLGRRSECI